MVSRSAWQDVHLFVSSTFRDTQAERDVLVRRVFPVLRAELLPHKIRLIDIDLRWGIEGQDESGVVAVCMEVLEQALPRFIGIIGDRYGWIPPGSAVSVTEQEITAALGYENCHPLFLFRDPARPDGSESLDFLDDSDAGEDALQKAKKLSLLRTRIEESSTARVRSYQCSIHQGTVVPNAAFETQALDGLRESLRSLYATDDAPTELTPSDTVGHALNFASERAAEWLSGLRDDELSHLTNFLKTNKGHVHILGEGGSGKTSLLAKTLDDILDKSNDDGKAVLAAFCGAHRGAESGEAVLRGFADRLVDTSIPASDDHDPSRPPSDFDGLRAWFARRITDTKAILLIDGIDHLPERDRFLTWLPNPVPNGVTVLTGSLDATSTTLLSEHWKTRATDVITLAPLDNLAGAGFVKSQLTRYRKTLSEAALSALLAKPGASTPLYLRIAAEELRTKGVRENLENDISGMPGTAGGMFLWVLQRLASDHQFRWSDGQSAVASLVGCLGIARDGLSEEELVALLSGTNTAGSDPTGDVAVMLQLLRPYLGRRGERYAPLHRVFSEALHGVGITDADRSLLGSEHPAPLDELSEVQRAHAQLASLFAEMPADHFRRLSEEAWHRIQSGDLDGAYTLLTDFSALKSRVEAGLVRGVLDDMDALVRAASGVDWSIPEELRVWQRLFRRRREFWEQFPDEFHQDCLNEAEGLPTTKSAKAIPIDKPWIRWVNKPEHEVRHGWEWMVRDASCAAFSPDGKTVAVGGTDGSLRLIDAESGYEIWRLTGHGDSVCGLEFCPNGKRIVTCSKDSTAQLWDATTGQPITKLIGHSSRVNVAAFSPDGMEVWTGSNDSTLRIWNSTTGQQLHVIADLSAPVYEIETSVDGRLMAVAGASHKVLIISALDRSVFDLYGHEDNVTGINFNPTSDQLLTTSRDQTAKLWDVSSKSILHTIAGHVGPVNNGVFSPCSNYIVTASHDGTVRVWSSRDGNEVFRYSKHEGPVKSVKYCRNGEAVLTGSADKSAHFWDVSQGNQLFALFGHESWVFESICHDRSERILTRSLETIRLWNLNGHHDHVRPCGHNGPVRSARYSTDGMTLVTGSFDKSACIWDTQSCELRTKLEGHEWYLWSAELNESASLALTSSFDGTARLWDTNVGTELIRFTGHTSPVRCAAFSNDETLVLTASEDNTARLWDITTGKLIDVISGHESYMYSAGFSSKDDLVVTASHDKTVRIWDVTTCQETKKLIGHQEWVQSASFSSDDSLVASVSGDESIRIWDVDSGVLLATYFPNLPKMQRVKFADSNRMVAVETESSGTHLLDVLTGEVLAEHMPAASLIGNLSVFSGDTEGVGLTIYVNGKRFCLHSHLDSRWFWNAVSINPTDPLSFVAGCADGSVRFFRLEGVELPTNEQTAPKA